MNKTEILIIDDEPQMRKLLSITLESNDYYVIQASNGNEGMIMAGNHPPEMILLDIGLPDKSGHVVLRELRQWYEKPIVIISAKNNEEDIVLALDHGANDYLVKPFRTGELLARLRSVLRSRKRDDHTPWLFPGGLEVDLEARTVKKNNKPIRLTSTEYQLLALFIRERGKALTHQYILKEVWGPGFIRETQYLRVYIGQLRKKIEDDPNHPVYLITESGVGYRFAAEE